MPHRLLRAVLILGLAFCFSGCGYKEGVLVREPVGYVWFTGNLQDVLVRIDGGEPFPLTRAAAVREAGDGKVHYQIAPGKRRFVAERGGQKVVDRVVYVGDGTIQEIQIP